ncbi:cell-cycle protein [Oceanobacillus iheyensis HTE831]|uniref:tRNA(Ile)-lysidine synthase n=1 Tax=Oceanobacillus iheyensis (strain DSM 14371 / CIP 107618 / JCM 11309 / KCTC 3954 / HTE831) TaxID=221109 RepID=TILS_OCEIH|nr:tRNA lysidine(34) synthetase TilS [Oceanobacillus iheyensis]Q8EU18.1 RecName: Full=tRNA(Ile)-lysidine synthase; AltName: Full=tRNA(Ile)-2-lysyl-cytidine synthase; AltName: Full=tRNA(Ile)-lysidine synthetase [Oceanobacillus iheyensis HTE831]BAC12033.1 cell-cycle protein [Oceanobacillus iheyensis HTE831]
MKQSILSFIQKHQLLKEGAKIIVGVSGGSDSMALLHFLKNLQEQWEIEVIALTINHQLRGEDSTADQKFVEQWCFHSDIRCIAHQVDVGEYQRQYRVSEELAARRLRYEIYEAEMRKQGADYLALGHHGDDQVETLFMRLTRVATSNAFEGIPVKRSFASGQLIRPFLCVNKQLILNYVKENEVPFREDQTNKDNKYTRNYYRNEIIPLLTKNNERLFITAQRLSETLREDENYLAKEANRMVEEVIIWDENFSKISFSNQAFIERPHALQRRAYHLILNYLYDTLPKDLSYIHEEKFFALIERQEGNTYIDFPLSLRVENSYGKIQLYFPNRHPRHSVFHLPLQVPDQVELPDGARITSEWIDATLDKNSRNNIIIPIDSVALPLHIRTRKPGDRMTWDGLKGTKKLKDIWIDAKIPTNERDTWPIVTDDNNTIIWLVGLKKAFGSNQFCQSGEKIKLSYHKGNI